MKKYTSVVNWIYGKLTKHLAFFNKENKQVELLRGYVKNSDILEANKLAKNITSSGKKYSDYVLYIKGWSDYKLNNYPEAIDSMSILLKKNKENLSYYSIRGNSYYRQNEYKNALHDFEAILNINPNNQSAYTKLLQTKTKLNIDTSGYENLIQIQHNLSVNFLKRNWEEFDFLLRKIKDFEEISFQYWSNKKNLFFMQDESLHLKWRKLHDLCIEKKHKLAASVFKSYIESLVSVGKLNQVIEEIPKFKSLYNTHYPTTYLSGACALFYKKQKHKEGLLFLDSIKSQIQSTNEQIRFKIKALPYYSLYKNQSNISQPKGSNFISENLISKMKLSYPKNSASDQVVKEAMRCWDVITLKSEELLLDIRYNENQSKKLRNIILNAIKNETPLSLLRIGDGECYGLSEYCASSESEIIAATLEEFWWGKQISRSLQSSIKNDFLETFKDANIIGMPYSIRLSQTLLVEQNQKLSYSDQRLKMVFEGTHNLIDQFELSPTKVWTDEYCNYALADKNFITELIKYAPKIIVVTCFNIPKGNILYNPKIESILIPPVQKVANLANTMKTEKILPEIMKDICLQVTDKITPGTVVLVCAGFAGKFLLQASKRKGAIAIDFGSSIDHLLGHQTRNLELHTLFH